MPRRKSAALSEIETRIDANAVLSAEEKDAIRERARKHVHQARKEKDTDRLFDAMVKEAERSSSRTSSLRILRSICRSTPRSSRSTT